MPELNVLNQKITYIKIEDEDYISITDMLKSKDGRYGGTYAHKDISFEFGMWISPKFKLLLISVAISNSSLVYPCFISSLYIVGLFNSSSEPYTIYLSNTSCFE